MKFLKIFLVIIAIVIAIFFIGGLFLPKTYAVNRSIDIAAKDSVVYQNIADFNRFLQWNAWSKMDTTTKYKVSGTPGQVGHQYHWTGEKMGEGDMKITGVQPFKQVNMELKFIKPLESLANVVFDLTNNGTGTKVTWTMSGENNILGKWMCVFVSMDKMIGKDFEDGLKSLKEKSEQQ